jgi:hypothetical protein
MNDQSNSGMHIQPQDFSKTFENALHLYKGNHDKLPELLKDAGTLLLKASRKLSTTQLILVVGVVACGVAFVAVNIAKQQEEEDRLQASSQGGANPGDTQRPQSGAGI